MKASGGGREAAASSFRCRWDLGHAAESELSEADAMTEHAVVIARAQAACSRAPSRFSISVESPIGSSRTETPGHDVRRDLVRQRPPHSAQLRARAEAEAHRTHP